MLISGWSTANSTIATLQTGWSGANATISSLLSTYATATLHESISLNYSTHCNNFATQINSGLDNGDGNGTASDGQLHSDEIDSTEYICPHLRLVKDIQQGTGSSSPSLLTAYDGMVFFVANDNIHGRELWKSDGTLTGTKVVKDITPGSSSTSFNCLFVLGNWLYFSAYTSAYGGELWKTDGTSNGTVSVTNPNFSSNSLELLNFVYNECLFRSKRWTEWC